MADFVRDPQAHAARIKANGVPEVLTVDGHEGLVVLDVEGYQALLDRIEKAELLDSLRQGIRDGEAGLGVTVVEARTTLREKHGF